MERMEALTELAQRGSSTASGTGSHRWRARFIAAAAPAPQGGPCPLFRTEFELAEAAATATLRISALGVYEVFINGRRVGDELLAPGWTSYPHRLTYRTFDVVPFLRPGRNVIGAILADGWFRGRLGFHGGRTAIYGDDLALLAEIQITDQSGQQTLLATDSSWSSTAGPILASSLYDGETHDARLEPNLWLTPEFGTAGWHGVRELEHNLSTLVPATAPPIRTTQELQPVEWWTTSDGTVVADFGQNIAGRLRINVDGEAGEAVTIRHAEVLEDGRPYYRPLRTAAATDRYMLRGGGPETWEPRFTYHGFRYAEIAGWPGEFDPNDVTAVVIHCDMERIGWFECSNDLLNRLHQNAVWSMRCNAVSIPTDCPQRDERLAWTGDVQVFAPSAAYLYDVRGFLGSWLADLAAEQSPAGSVNHLVPDIMALLPDVVFSPTGAAGWGDAAVFVPWALYMHYGDLEVLRTQYASMKAWVDYVASRAAEDHLWLGDFQFGDWLDPSAPPDRPERGLTDPDLVATAYFGRSAKLLSLSADALGRTDDAARYAELFKNVASAFSQRYLTEGGRLSSDSQAAYALALEFELLEGSAERAAAALRLAELVREAKHRIGTGFLATPLICDALANNGYLDDAYALLLQEECPSWLYQVRQGATTIWERWDSMLPDGHVNPGDMTSFNHFAFGAIVDWMHRSVAGLAPAAPGYERILIRPLIGGGLTHAQAKHLSPHGMIEVSWSIAEDKLRLAVAIPDGAAASVYVPGVDRPVEVAAGTHSWSVNWTRETKTSETVAA
jgi:alpha-L-rhamnosidase